MQLVSSWEWPDLGFKLLVAQNVLDLFEKNKQRQGMNECGGQLFVDVSSSAGLIISDATPPNQRDIAAPTSLIFDPARCRKEVQLFNSKGLFLVGYWHTHSEEDPQISYQDLKSFSKFSCDNYKQLPYPIAVIVGQSKVRVWSMRNTPIAGRTVDIR